jgi:Tfp pilus assembly protein PilZ
MTASDTLSGKYPVIARLFELINHVSEDRLLIILKELLKDKFSDHIFKLVIDLPDEQQSILLKQLEKTAHPLSRDDRRKYSRKPCLMPVDYSVQGRLFKGYILDISVHGVFIETSDYFFSGQEIIMNFSVPHYQKPLTVTGQIVWSSQNGVGIKFSQLSPHQNQMIKAFSETPETVYKIAS